MKQSNTEPWVKTTCPYCGVGCGVKAKVERSGRVTIEGDKSHPANYGRLCSKGLALAETLLPDGRLLTPQVKGKPVSIDAALHVVASGFSDTIARYGPDSVAFYVSGQLLTEDYYVANKLMKGFIGSANIDTNSRLCMSSTVEGHKRAFGSDTVPDFVHDLERTGGSINLILSPQVMHKIRKVAPNWCRQPLTVQATTNFKETSGIERACFKANKAHCFH